MLTPEPSSRPSPHSGPTFPPLELETRTAIPTGAAAYYLARKQQTLRIWAAYGSGPIQPLRVHCRLLWPVSEIRKLLGVTP